MSFLECSLTIMSCFFSELCSYRAQSLRDRQANHIILKETALLPACRKLVLSLKATIIILVLLNMLFVSSFDTFYTTSLTKSVPGVKAKIVPLHRGFDTSSSWFRCLSMWSLGSQILYNYEPSNDPWRRFAEGRLIRTGTIFLMILLFRQFEKRRASEVRPATHPGWKPHPQFFLAIHGDPRHSKRHRTLRTRSPGSQQRTIHSR